MFYNARWDDPSLGRFAQADTIVPGGVQGLDRYAYVNSNPMNATDPSGHRCAGESEECLDENGKTINGSWVGDIPFMFTGLPVSGITWTQWFGPTKEAFGRVFCKECDHNIYSYSQSWHAAIDLGASAGTVVYSTTNQSGVVLYIASGNPGDSVYVQYGDVIVIYQHIVASVESGQTIEPGDAIGTIIYQQNSNGSDNSHLHLEVRSADQSIIYNPLKFMPENVKDSLLSPSFVEPDEFCNGYALRPDDPLSYIDTEIIHYGPSLWKGSVCE